MPPKEMEGQGATDGVAQALHGNASSEDVEYFKLEYGSLPNELFRSKTPIDAWFRALNLTAEDGSPLASSSATAGKNGFPPNALGQISQIPPHVEWERVVGVALYMISNVMPFLLPMLLLASFVLLPAASMAATVARCCLAFVIVYTALLFAIETFYFEPYFKKVYKRPTILSNDIKDNQYVYTEFHSGKYHSTKYVWPKSIHYPALGNRPVIFCAVPHGIIPMGITSYPLWSKVWNDRLCHWTCAPVVLKLPVVGFLLRKMGYIPAKSRSILDTLQKKEENVGVILDGIAGMFHSNASSSAEPGVIEEIACLKERKGIVKIALKAGVPIIPVYGFGHTAMYQAVVDPFGILRKLSLALDTAVTPFIGRWGWFLGPPPRVPLAICLGNPVQCPQIAEPTQQEIDDHHAKMVAEFVNVFETHKGAYGWSNRKLKVV